MTPEEHALIEAARAGDEAAAAKAEAALREAPVWWARRDGCVNEWIRDLRAMGRDLEQVWQEHHSRRRAA